MNMRYINFSIIKLAQNKMPTGDCACLRTKHKFTTIELPPPILALLRGMSATGSFSLFHSAFVFTFFSTKIEI